MLKTSDKLNIYVREDNYAWAVFPQNEKSNVSAREWASRDTWGKGTKPKEILLDANNKFDYITVIGYEHRQSRSVFKVKTPTGLIFDLGDKEILDIILTIGVKENGLIQHPTYFVQDKAQMRLIAEGSKTDLALKEELAKAEANQGLSKKLIVGKTYQRKNKSLFIYLGEMNVLEPIYGENKLHPWDKPKIGMKYNKKHIVIDNPNYIIPLNGDIDDLYDLVKKEEYRTVNKSKESSYLTLSCTAKPPAIFALAEKQYSHMDLDRVYKEHIKYNFFLDVIYLTSFQLISDRYNYSRELSKYLSGSLLMTQDEYDKLLEEGFEFHKHILALHKSDKCY